VPADIQKNGQQNLRSALDNLGGRKAQVS
jgi:hypothetical protein